MLPNTHTDLIQSPTLKTLVSPPCSELKQDLRLLFNDSLDSYRSTNTITRILLCISIRHAAKPVNELAYSFLLGVTVVD